MMLMMMRSGLTIMMIDGKAGNTEDCRNAGSDSFGPTFFVHDDDHDGGHDGDDEDGNGADNVDCGKDYCDTTSDSFAPTCP